MRLDSEEQREQLIKLIEAVPIQVTLGSAAEAQASADAILNPIRDADIEDAPRARQQD